ncbi:MAG TPA: MBL fold metallo-hydrolase [Solirubrobacterales bacterium]|nr:MBL fold metallo-hydrolase [Solirubrobacterales bacterium]
MTEVGTRITYVGHATVLIEMEGVRLITDPVLRRRIGPLWRHGPPPDRRATEDVDAVLISHLHHDHADVPSLRRLNKEVPVFGPPGSGSFLRRHGFAAVHELAPGNSGSVGGVRIAATKALHPTEGRRFERASQAVGFVLSGRRRIYFAGDTDLFDGMEDLAGGLDLALLPVWGWGPSLGPGHLDPERAARAAALLSPRVAVPIHWGTLFPLGLSRLAADRLSAPPREFARAAAALAPQVEVRVLSPGEATSLS